MDFSDYGFSLRFRDMLKQTIRGILDTERPKYRYGLVTAVDLPAGKASVRMTGDTAPVLVSIMQNIPHVGDTVQVAGQSGDKFISGIVGTGSRAVSGERISQVDVEIPAGTAEQYTGFGSAASHLMGGMEAVGNYGLRVPVTGIYLVSGGVRWASVSGSSISTQIRIYQNNSQRANHSAVLAGASGETLSAARPLDLSANSVLSLYLYTQTTRSTSMATGSWPRITYLSATLLGT